VRPSVRLFSPPTELSVVSVVFWMPRRKHESTKSLSSPWIPSHGFVSYKLSQAGRGEGDCLIPLQRLQRIESITGRLDIVSSLDLVKSESTPTGRDDAPLTSRWSSCRSQGSRSNEDLSDCSSVSSTLATLIVVSVDVLTDQPTCTLELNASAGRRPSAVNGFDPRVATRLETPTRTFDAATTWRA